MRFVLGLVAVVAGAVLTACSGGDDGGDGAPRPDAGSPATNALGTAAPTDVPASISELTRVCTTQVGFRGVTRYTATAGIHPVVLFQDHRGVGFAQSPVKLPDGWSVEEDAKVDDTSDLRRAQLVACSNRVEETPTGKRCEFGRGDSKVELELFDAAYEVKVYAATTGELKVTQTLVTDSSECPSFAAYRKGDRKYVNDPSTDDYINTLKALVAR